MITYCELLANKFNNFFINVAENLSKKNKKPNTDYQDYLKNPNKSSLCLTETTPHEIYQIIQKFNSNKGADIFGISAKNLKLASPKIDNNVHKLVILYQI